MLNPEAWCRLSIRLVAGMEPQQVVAATKARLRALAPAGAELELTGEGGARAWRMDCSHPAYAAARAALAHAGIDAGKVGLIVLAIRIVLWAGMLAGVFFFGSWLRWALRGGA